MFAKPCPDIESPLRSVPYQFLSPALVRLRKPDGKEVVVGYGIGDLVEVMQPEMDCLVYHGEREEIPLADGSAIIAWEGRKDVHRWTPLS